VLGHLADGISGHHECTDASAQGRGIKHGAAARPVSPPSKRQAAKVGRSSSGAAGQSPNIAAQEWRAAADHWRQQCQRQQPQCTQLMMAVTAATH
jgi:hypothetical protein